jgi:2-dehydropantoate 2-reductase
MPVSGEPSSAVRATVAILGLGSIGGVAAGSLLDGDRHDLVACVRSPVERLVLERPEGLVDRPLRCLTDPAQAGPVDWVLLATKAHQTPSCAPWLSRLCGPGTRVAVLQNGIEQKRRYAGFVGPAVIVPTIVYYNGERLAADRVRLRHVGEFDLAVGDDAGGGDLARLFEGTRLKILVAPDFAMLAWRKLLINAVANPMTALTLQRQSVLRRDDIGALCLAVLDEAVSVARAEGIPFGPDEAARTMANLLTYPAEAGTSMYFDRLAGRSFEVEALTGAIVAAGERHAIATPMNRVLLTLLRAISDAAGNG